MIYFVRHGESEANLKGVFAGQKEDSPLTLKGREQAFCTARIIKDCGTVINRIISSPLRRAMETVRIIAGELGLDKRSIQIDSRITEYDMGSLTDTPIREISSVALVSAKDAENPEDFRDRVLSFFEELSRSQEKVLIVSHAGVGRMIETIKYGKDPKLFYDIPAYPNASINEVVLAK